MLLDDELATAITLVMKSAIAPVLERVSAIEAAAAKAVAEAELLTIAKFADVRERLAALETRNVETLTASVGELRAQVAILEARAPIPGPPGPAGRDGVDGKGLSYLGVHVAGKTYDAGDLVTEDGSVFYCARTTTAKPGTTHDWQLMVKRGRDARGGPR